MDAVPATSSRQQQHKDQERQHAPPTPPQLPSSIDGPDTTACEEDVAPASAYPTWRPPSADDLNPAVLHTPMRRPLSGHPSSTSSDPAAAVIDFRQLSRAQIAAAARRHNVALNILDPVGEVLQGIR